MQLRTLVYALLIAGATSAYMLLLDQADRLSWVKPALLTISLAFFALGIFSSIKRGDPSKRGGTGGMANRSRRGMGFAIMMTLCGLGSIYFSGTLLVRTAEGYSWISLIGGLFAFFSGLVQLTQEWRKRE